MTHHPINTPSNTPARILASSLDLDRYGDHELLTLIEVAAILRAEVNTLRYWRQLGTGPRFFKIGRRLVTTTADLRTWIDTQRNGTGPSTA